MKHLFALAFKKIAFYRQFWTFTLLYGVVLMLILSGVYKLGSLTIENQEVLVGQFFKAPFVWILLTNVAGIGHVFLSFMAVMMFHNDLNNRMFRSHVMNGLSRSQAFAHHFFICVLMACYSLGVVVGAGSLFAGFGALAFDKASLHMFAGLFTHGLVYFSFAMLLAHFIRNSMACAFVFLSSVFIIEPVLSYIADIKIRAGISDFFPGHIIGQLLPGWIQLLNGQAGQFAVSGSAWAMACGYCLCFSLLAWVRVSFSDL